MRCQCGASIPDNVEYCPYCGKQQFIRTRPEQLTGGKRIEPFQGYYAGGGGKPAGCLGQLVGIVIFVVAMYFMLRWGLHYFGMTWWDLLESFGGLVAAGPIEVGTPMR